MVTTTRSYWTNERRRAGVAAPSRPPCVDGTRAHRFAQPVDGGRSWPCERGCGVVFTDSLRIVLSGSEYREPI